MLFGGVKTFGSSRAIADLNLVSGALLELCKNGFVVTELLVYEEMMVECDFLFLLLLGFYLFFYFIVFKTLGLILSLQSFDKVSELVVFETVFIF